MGVFSRRGRGGGVILHGGLKKKPSLGRGGPIRGKKCPHRVHVYRNKGEGRSFSEFGRIKNGYFPTFNGDLEGRSEGLGELGKKKIQSIPRKRCRKRGIFVFDLREFQRGVSVGKRHMPTGGWGIL